MAQPDRDIFCHIFMLHTWSGAILHAHFDRFPREILGFHNIMTFPFTLLWNGHFSISTLWWSPTVDVPTYKVEYRVSRWFPTPQLPVTGICLSAYGSVKVTLFPTRPWLNPTETSFVIYLFCSTGVVQFCIHVLYYRFKRDRYLP